MTLHSRREIVRQQLWLQGAVVCVVLLVVGPEVAGVLMQGHARGEAAVRLDVCHGLTHAVRLLIVQTETERNVLKITTVIGNF